MRITMGMMNNSYKKDLNSAKETLDRYFSRASTYRAFDKPSEDPLAASQSYEVQWEITSNEAYNSNLDNVQSSVTTAESTLQLVDQLLSEANGSDVIKGINGSMPQSARDTIADKLLKTRESLVSHMNLKYADQYLFAGSGSESVPFTVDGNGELLYRGVNVNTGKNTNGACAKVASSDGKSTMQINLGKAIADKLNGYNITVNADAANTSNSVAIDSSSKTIAIKMKGGSNKEDLQNLLQGVGGDTTFKNALDTAGVSSVSADNLKGINISGLPASNSDKLKNGSTSEKITDIVDMKALANDKVYVDIGIGMKTDSDGNIIDASAYDTAMNGISFLGYGKSKNGVNNNMYSLMGDIAGKLKDSSLSNQSLIDAVDPLTDSFNSSQDSFRKQQSQLGTKMVFLKGIKTQLGNISDNLAAKENQVAFVNPSDAINDYAWEQLCYNATMQMGTKILQPTLFDYMR